MNERAGDASSAEITYAAARLEARKPNGVPHWAGSALSVSAASAHNPGHVPHSSARLTDIRLRGASRSRSSSFLFTHSFRALDISRRPQYTQQSMASGAENSSLTGADSDDDFDWEEVDVPQHEPQLDLSLEDDLEKGPTSSTRPHIEITIKSAKAENQAAK